MKDLAFPRRHPRNTKRLAAVGGVLLLLTGCNSLPASGPTEGQFNREQRNPQKNTVGYSIVQVSPELIDILDSEAPPLFASLTTDNTPIVRHNNDTIGPGDVLQISIYEVGSALFSPSSAAMAASSADSATTMPTPSTSSALPLISVDGEGNIKIPYAGQVHVAGMTTSQAAREILAGLKDKSQSPQVMVRIAADIANSVMVYGGVRRPSRIPLTPNRERILDVIALAGGADRQTQSQYTSFVSSDEDYVIRLTRNGRIAELPLKTIENDPAQNIVMQPGDRVQLTFEPRSFTVFGASGHVTQTQFTTPTLTMAEAISRSGGPIDSRADPNAVYLFRFENADVLRHLGVTVDSNATTAPVVYQLDMMNPSNYFLAQKFMMHDRDLIYVANSASNKFYKFFGLISTIIAPGITAAWIAK